MFFDAGGVTPEEQRETTLMKRFAELESRSQSRGIYTYSGFMYEYEALPSLSAEGIRGYQLYGGFPEAERVIVRFGSKEKTGYEEPWPISILEVTPLNDRFSDDLQHRDILGSLMSLGIERDVIGDILIKERRIRILVLERMAEYICKELTRIRHTSVSAVITDHIPEDALPRRERLEIIVSSERADTVVSGLYKMSRTKAKDLFAAGKVFVNGAECHSADRPLKETDVVTVRGFGKFTCLGKFRKTRKGRDVVTIERTI